MLQFSSRSNISDWSTQIDDLTDSGVGYSLSCALHFSGKGNYKIIFDYFY